MKRFFCMLCLLTAIPGFALGAEEKSKSVDTPEADGGVDAGYEALPEEEVEPLPVVDEAPVAALVEKKKKDNDKKKKDKKKKSKEDSSVEIGGRVHALYEMSHYDYPGEDQGDYDNRFLLRRTQLKAVWRPNKWLMGVIEIGTEQRVEVDASLLRDVYIHLSPSRYVELRAGQFKKPFSRLEMRSPRKTTVIEKGDGNRLIIDELMYGERDLGVQLSGRLIRSVNLDYAVGVFNGNGPEITNEGNSKDLVGRLEIRPIKQLDLGVNGSFKFFDAPGGAENSWAAGADARVRIDGFRVHLEGLLAEDHAYTSAGYLMEDPRLVMDLVGIVSYRHYFPISWRLGVEPVFKFEALDPDIEITEDHVFILGPGFNTYLGKHFRVMIHAEFRRGGRNTNWEDDLIDREMLMVQLCFDI